MRCRCLPQSPGIGENKKKRKTERRRKKRDNKKKRKEIDDDFNLHKKLIRKREEGIKGVSFLSINN